MVRVKYRYVVVKVELQNEQPGRLTFGDNIIYRCIMRSVQKYYGDVGVAAVQYGLKTKYCNDQTRIAIVRIRHRVHRFVTSILPMVATLDTHLIKFRVLYNGATIKQCNKCIVEYQKKFLDVEVGNIASKHQRMNLMKNCMQISTVNK